MKKYLIIALAVASAACAFAKPARRYWHRYQQPDGTYITVTMTGDENRHSVRSTDGRLLKFDRERGYVEVAEGLLESAPRKMRRPNVAMAMPERVRQSMPQTRGIGLTEIRFPSKGEQRALVILAEYKDVKFNSKNKSPYKPADPKAYFSDMLNKEGFNTYGGTGSARDFFIQNSKGQFKPQFDVYGPVTLSNNASYYGKNDAADNDARATEVVIEACKLLDSQINFKDYDRDGDGYVDNVYVFYAGYGEADIYPEDEETYNTVWPHAWYISGYTETDNKPGYPLVLDGVKIDSYGMSNETIGIDDPYSYSYANRPDGIGTFVHEFSHVLGLPDLYATTDYYDENSDAWYKDVPFTPGNFSCMDSGPYNNGGKTPPNYSMYERYALDWVTPREFTLNSTVAIPNLADSNEGYLVKTDKSTEFFLFENRQLTGWDTYIPWHGMLVWHVDYNQKVYYENEVNNTKDHQYVDLIEADNIQDYPTGVDLWGDLKWPKTSTLKGDPFPGNKNVRSFGYSTTPSLRSWSGKNLGIMLNEITETSGKITANITDSTGGSSVEESVAGVAGGDIYNMQGVKVAVYEGGTLPELPAGIYIIRTTDGRTVKIINK